MSDPFDRLTAALADRYALESELGSGGMATVYLADDLKHKRKVAVKVLNPEVAAMLGAERFLKEIEVTANLQHPNILPLYDSGEADGFLYYVMPHIEGESLRHKMIRQKQLTVEEAVSVATAVAAALQFAHERHVIHRDIKPENILLQSGQALVADFGIALAVSEAGGTRMTETGLSLGTPHYMSPEQATADRELDARSDVYSLGAMTYEMLVGDPPHTGGNPQAVIAKILSDRPQPVSRSRDLVPANVDAAIRKALARSPADRFQRIEHFADALRDPGFTIAPDPTRGEGTVDQHNHEAPVEVTASRRRWRIAAFASMAAAILATVVAIAQRTSSVNNPVSEIIEFTIGERGPIRGGLFAVSADGMSILITGGLTGDGTQIRRLDQTEPIPFPVNDVVFGSFSPDGEAVAFARAEDGPLEVATITGTGRNILADRISNRPVWSEDGYIYFVEVGNEGVRHLVRVPQAGGSIDTLLAGSQRPGVRRVLAVLPGRFVLYQPALSQPGLGILNINTGDASIELTEAQINVAAFSNADHVLYGDGPSLQAISFDARSGSLAGDPFPVVRDTTGFVAFAAGGETLVYTHVHYPGATIVVTSRRDGSTHELENIPPGIALRGINLSPDGRSVVAATAITPNWFTYSNADIWTYTFPDGPFARITRTADLRPVTPAWWSDGTQIVFSRGADVYSVPTVGSGEMRLFQAEGDVSQVHARADGQQIYFELTVNDGSDIGVFDRNAGSDPRGFLEAEYSERFPAESPDGRWLAFQSDQTGRNEVHIVSTTTPTTRSQISRTGGQNPRWSHDGSGVFFVVGDSLMFASLALGTDVAVQTPEFVVAAPSRQFVPLTRDTAFAFVVPSPPGIRNALTVVRNFTALIEGR